MLKINNEEIKLEEIKHDSLYHINDFLLTPTGAIMLNKYHTDKILQEQMDYQDRITSYINRKHELNIKKEYNPKIVNLYENGELIINQVEYKLKDFYIVFKDNDYNIKCIDERFNNTECNYDKAVKFIDTTAFINLVNSKDVLIKDQKIIINSLDILNNIVSNWDGYIHNETKETEAIINKKMIEGDSDE